MVKKMSLKDLMHDMASSPDALAKAQNDCLDDGHNKNQAIPDMAIVPIYAGLDPLLTELFRQYLEAHRQYKSLTDLRGKDDPMADAARDWMESAESAVQTRMIELRQDDKIHAQARLILKQQARREKYNSLMAASKKYQSEQNDLFQRQRMMMAATLRKEGEDGFFMMVYLLWMLRAVTDRLTKTLSLASSFMAVAVIDNDGGLYAKA